MAAMKPLAIDLFCGLGGWTDGLLAEGYDVIGFDIERHEYGDDRYPAKLVLQDVLTLHGSQFKDAALIVASPPCQEFSYMAMPWSRAKQIARALRGEGEFPEGYRGSRTIAELTALFDACFRIQREASEAAGRHIPLVVENVRGCEPWVGKARWNFGSYYLWGDVPALMPRTLERLEAVKAPGMNWSDQSNPNNRRSFTENGGRKNGELGGGSWFNIGSPGPKVTGANPDGRKNPGFRFDGSGKSFQSESVNRHVEAIRAENHAGAGIKQGGNWRHDPTSASRTSGSKSPARKAASAKIAKIPFALSSWIARAYKPKAITNTRT